MVDYVDYSGNILRIPRIDDPACTNATPVTRADLLGKLCLASRKSQYESEIGPRREFDPDAPIEKGKLLRMSISEMKECQDDGGGGGGNYGAASIYIEIPSAYALLHGSLVLGSRISASAAEGSGDVALTIDDAIPEAAVFNYRNLTGVGSISVSDTWEFSRQSVDSADVTAANDTRSQILNTWPLAVTSSGNLSLHFSRIVAGGVLGSVETLETVNVDVVNGVATGSVSYSMSRQSHQATWEVITITQKVEFSMSLTASR